MPSYKLTYFNMAGLAEHIRYLLSYAKVDFVDNRIEKEDWEKLKPAHGSEFGKLPTLEIDGKIYHQSNSMGRFAAKLGGIEGKTATDALEADAIVDTLNDFRLALMPYAMEQDEAKKAALLQKIKDESAPHYFSKLDAIVARNGGHFVKDQLTWADVYFSSFVYILTLVVGVSFLDAYPNLKGLKQKVENLPGIKEYIAKRPKTTR